jgi:hypothetical protein
MGTADRPLGVADIVGHVLAGLVCLAFGHTTNPCLDFCIACGADLPAKDS